MHGFVHLSLHIYHTLYVATTEMHVSESYTISSFEYHLEILLFMYVHKRITYHGQPFLSTFAFTQHTFIKTLHNTAVLVVVEEFLM